MSDELAADFDKADAILAEALQGFIDAGVNPYVYGMALMEIGVAALIKVGEDEESIVDSVRQLHTKVKPGMIQPGVPGE